MPKEIREAGPLGTVREAKSGRLKVGLITPGWGSSGYYSAQVLENAAAAKVFPAGTQMFLDHPGEAERYDRPERSVRDLAATLTEDAVWDGSALVGEAQVFGAFRDTLTDEDFAKAIGVSIRAYADQTVGEAEGRKGTIITELTEAVSVDFVTRAGRGGSILAVLESARPEQVRERAIAHGVSEATANDIRTALMDALKGAYGGDKTWVWVRDFDETTVWFDFETPDQQTIYQQGYTLADDGAATLADGDPLEVRTRTEYVPVTAAESGRTITLHLDASLDPAAVSRQVAEALAHLSAPPNAPAPAGQSTATESEETTMATTQIEEAELGRLRQDAERAQTLESERNTAQRERDEAREAAAADRRLAEANRVIADADHPFTALERRGLLVDLPVVEGATYTSAHGGLDVEAFTARVAEHVAEAQEAAGAGSIRGFGRTTSTNVDEARDAWAQIDKDLNIGQEG